MGYVSDNLLLNITMPAGLRLKDGRTLKDPACLTVMGNISPWYASVEQVRIEGGIYLTKLPDMTIAMQVWQASKNADSISFAAPQLPTSFTDTNDPSYKRWLIFTHARNNYVAIQSAYDSIQNVIDLVGTRGSVTLGNFSTSRMSFGRDEGLPKKLTKMEDEIEKWGICLKSGGRTPFGGHAMPGFAAKGLYDNDPPPGRLWYTTGMGANRKSIPGYGSNGKPVKYGSPTFFQWRAGRNLGAYVTLLPRISFGG